MGHNNATGLYFYNMIQETTPKFKHIHCLLGLWFLIYRKFNKTNYCIFTYLYQIFNFWKIKIMDFFYHIMFNQNAILVFDDNSKDS